MCYDKREELRNILRTVEETITMDELAKKMNMPRENLEKILYDITIDVKKEFNSVAYQLPTWNKERLEEFFQRQIVDLRFLCPHKIEEVKEGEVVEESHNTIGHQFFYNNWMLYRGY